MAWYSHLFKDFPQFIVIHTVKGFGIVNIYVLYMFFFRLFHCRLLQDIEYSSLCCIIGPIVYYLLDMEQQTGSK